jgi:hypothetical protein
MSIQPSAIRFQQKKEYNPRKQKFSLAEHGSLTAEGDDKDAGNV